MSRPETGPMQFEDDWPGIFIRGDNALHYAMQIRLFLKYPNYPLARAYLESLARRLEACNVDHDPIPQRAVLLDACLNAPDSTGTNP